MATLHEYPVSIEWTGGRDGSGSATAATSGTKVGIAVPPEFQGPGGGTNPEELLTSAIASCYTITYGIIATNRRIPVEKIETNAVGVVEQQGMIFNYKQITIRPTITLSSGATDDQVTAATDNAHKADNYCIITNAVRGKVEVIVEPTVIRE